MHRKLQQYTQLLLSGSLLLLTAYSAKAQETLLATDITLQPYEKWTAQTPANIAIPTGQKAYLNLRARINASSVTTGSQPAFRVTFDRVPIDIGRLANKKSSYNVNAVSHRVWYSPDGRFDALYDDFSKTSPQAWGRNHEYFFDVTDIVKADKKQTITIENLFDGVPGSVLELKDCKFIVSMPVARNSFPASTIPYYLSEGFDHWRKQATAPHKGLEVQLETGTDYSAPLTISSPPQFADVKATITGDNGMGLSVKLGDWQPMPLQTVIGTPATGWLQGKELQKLSSKQSWQTKEFQVERSFTTDKHGVVVRDRVTNLTTQDLPFAILHQLDVGDLSQLKEFRLYGKPEASFYANSIPSRESASYPVGYVRDAQRAYAFVMEDDSMRPQGSVMTWDSTVSFGSDMACLGPNASHTFQFRIVGAPSGNYFEILNRVRNAWNSYQTIPGLFGFVYPQGLDSKLQTPAQVKRFFDMSGITVPAIPNSTPAPPNSESERRMIYGTEPESMVREGLTSTSDPFAALMKQAGVDLPVLIYMDPHLIRSDGKKEILDTMADSVLNDIQGNRLDYRPGWLNVVVPQADNAAGKKIRENLNIYFDRPYIRGMFLDEWDHSRARHSFQHSDGLTARLNADLTLNAKIGLVPLLAKDFQRETVDFLTSRNAVTYVNQMAQTSFMQSLPLVHFAEPTQYDHYLLRSAQMARTPLSLNIKRTSGVWNDTYEFLKGGVLLAYYAKRLYGDHLLKYIYPIKVLGVQPGVVMAEDKIVTLRSGSYSFEDNASIEALIFGAPDGNLKCKATSQATPNGKHNLKLDLDSQKQEIALVRKVGQ